MSKQGTLIPVLLAGPKNTFEARAALRQEILEWNTRDGWARGIALVPQTFEDDSIAHQGGAAQTLFNKDTADRTDWVVAVFGSSLGTPTPGYPSGTAEEVERAVKSGRRASAFFLKSAPNLDEVDAAELTRVREYELQLKGFGIVRPCRDVRELRERFRAELATHVTAIVSTTDDGDQNVSRPPAESEPSGERQRALEGTDGEPTAFSHAAGLLQEGNLEDGLAALQVAAEADKTSTSPPEQTRAFGLTIAVVGGKAADALGLLRETAHQHPTDTEIQKWYAVGLMHEERFSDAAGVLRTLLVTEKSEAVDIAIRLAKSLAKLRQFDDAKDVLLVAYNRCSSADSRASLLRRLARLHLEKEPPDQHLAVLYFELALDLIPTDAEARFDLAYLYGEMNQQGMSYYHYEKYLQRNPLSGAAANNAGLAASALGLKFTAERLYRAGIREDEPLAVANLAHLFIDAGFSDDARNIIEGARKKGIASDSLEKASGVLATAKEEESSAAKSALQNADKLRSWSVRTASALMTSLADAAAFTGRYQSDSDTLQLVIHPSGDVSANLTFGTAKAAHIEGKLNGSLIRFRWRETDGPVSPSSAMGLIGIALAGPSSGLFKRPTPTGGGILIVEGQNLNGYWVEGDSDPNTAPMEARRLWSFSPADIPKLRAEPRVLGAKLN